MITKKSSFLSKNYLDILFLISLGVVILFSRLFFLQNYAINMYDYDSYTYYTKAIFYTSNHDQFFNPYIAFLSVLYHLSPYVGNSLLLLREINIVFSIQLIVFYYLIARKMFDPYISLISSVFAAFVPIFLSYSVTLHNDIFALSMGVASLYFSIRPKRLIAVFISIVFIIIAVLTRGDVFAVFIIPLVIGIAFYINRKTNKNFFLILGICLVIFAISAYFIGQDYYYSTTRFTPFEKLSLFLTPDTVNLVWQKSIAITDDDTLNKLFLGSLVVGIIFLAVKVLAHHAHKFNEANITAMYLTAIFFIYIISSSVFHIGYSIINDVVVISNHITTRYLIGNQILLVYGFTYSLSLLTGAVRLLRVPQNTSVNTSDNKL